jgi:hypothetical protein
MLSSLAVVAVLRVVAVREACYKDQIIQSHLAQHLQSRWAQEVLAVTEAQDKRVLRALKAVTLFSQDSRQLVVVVETQVEKLLHQADLVAGLHMTVLVAEELAVPQEVELLDKEITVGTAPTTVTVRAVVAVVRAVLAITQLVTTSVATAESVQHLH